mgnify:CR=1 FL=1
MLNVLRYYYDYSHIFFSTVLLVQEDRAVAGGGDEGAEEEVESAPDVAKAQYAEKGDYSIPSLQNVILHHY